MSTASRRRWSARRAYTAPSDRLTTQAMHAHRRRRTRTHGARPHCHVRRPRWPLCTLSSLAADSVRVREYSLVWAALGGEKDLWSCSSGCHTCMYDAHGVKLVFLWQASLLRCIPDSATAPIGAERRDHAHTLAPAPPATHERTHARSHTHTHAHAHTHPHAHTRAYARALERPPTHTLSRERTRL